jgi:hypothetical protein
MRGQFREKIQVDLHSASPAFQNTSKGNVSGQREQRSAGAVQQRNQKCALPAIGNFTATPTRQLRDPGSRQPPFFFCSWALARQATYREWRKLHH